MTGQKWRAALVLSLLIVSASAALGFAGGFEDTHSSNTLAGWTSYGARDWSETNGFMKAQDATDKTGFLITRYPCADDGTFEAVIQADQWSGQNGGLVFRWTTASSYYFVSVKPGNQFDSKLYLSKNTLDLNQATVLASNFDIGTSYTIKVVLTGAHFDFYLNNTWVAGHDDSSNPAGRAGYANTGQWNTYVSFDSSKWTDAAGSAKPTTSVEAINDPANAQVKVWIKDEGFWEANIVKPRVYFENIGSVIAKNFKAYYLFKAEAGKVVVLEDYYTPDCDVTLYDLGMNDYAVEYNYTGKGIAPGDAAPDRNGWVIGLHYDDWSALNKLDDPSNPGGPDWQPVTNIPVYGPNPTTTNGGSNTTPVNPDGSITVNKLTVINLHCNTTEDNLGEDEARLHFYIDGPEKDSFYADINDGQNRSVNREYIFSSNASISLYDEDSPDSDDFLGSININTTAGSFTGHFTGDDADYELTYKVEQIKVYPKKITVVKLHCNKTEDTTGEDETRLEIYQDGKIADTLKKDLNDNEEYSINKTYDFNHGMRFRLYDEDWPDDDDFLGQVQINTAVGEHIGMFTLDDADYILTYKVEMQNSVASGNQPQIGGGPIVIEKQVKKLIVKTLHCNTTEDNTGADESYMDIFIDGNLFETVNKDLNNGDNFAINKEYIFFSGASFRLMDEDTGVLGDDDDNLGSFSIDTSVGDHSGSFTGDDANYTLTYSVVLTNIPAQINSVHDLLIYNFEQSTQEGLWPSVDKAILIQGMKDRIITPTLVNQNDFPFCGPASIIYTLVRKNPLRYAALCRDLYLTAHFKMRTETLYVSGTTRTAVPPASMNQADWVAMASLRDDENVLWDVEPDANDFINGATTHWEMNGWTFELMGYNNADYHTTFVWGELDALDDARKSVEKNGVAYLMIDTDLIKGTQNSFWESLFSTGYPKHWIVFEGDATIDWGDWYAWDSGYVKFRYYSWGNNTKFVDTDEGTFEDHMFGVVFGY